MDNSSSKKYRELWNIVNYTPVEVSRTKRVLNSIVSLFKIPYSNIRLIDDIFYWQGINGLFKYDVGDTLKRKPDTFGIKKIRLNVLGMAKNSFGSDYYQVLCNISRVNGTVSSFEQTLPKKYVEGLCRRARGSSVDNMVNEYNWIKKII